MIVVNSFNEEERKEYVPLLKEIDTDREILYENDGSEGVNMTMYPRLNCYQQEDPKLIKAINDKIILSPSTSGNFKYFFFRSEGSQDSALSVPLSLCQAYC